GWGVLVPLEGGQAWGGGAATRGVGVGGGEATWCTTMACDASCPHPMTDGPPPAGGVWRRLCREPSCHGTQKGARAWVSGTRWDAAGHGRFSGAGKRPGADVWPRGETPRGLDPDGCVVRRPYGRHHAKANRGASEANSRGVACAQRNATEKSGPTLCKGEVWPLDRSLLMGVFPILRYRLCPNRDKATVLRLQPSGAFLFISLSYPN